MTRNRIMIFFFIRSRRSACNFFFYQICGRCWCVCNMPVWTMQVVMKIFFQFILSIMEFFVWDRTQTRLWRWHFGLLELLPCKHIFLSLHSTLVELVELIKRGAWSKFACSAECDFLLCFCELFWSTVQTNDLNMFFVNWMLSISECHQPITFCAKKDGSGSHTHDLGQSHWIA